MENNILNEIVLENWGGIRLNAKIDEDLKDVKLMIKYSDHGDEFLIVKTENEIYEYGWWLNRKREPEYDTVINSRYDYGFVRKPELFCSYYETLKGTGRINGVDGFAGKISYNGDCLLGDKLEFIYYKGKILDLSNVKMDRWFDDWHYEVFELSLKQFE